MSSKDHNKLIGILLLVMGGLKLIGGIIIALVYGGLGIFAVTNSHKQDDQFLGTVFIVIGIIAATAVFIFALIDFIAGWKMFKEKPNARTWGIVSSIISLPSLPFGTALGVYGLWFLFGEQGKQFYLANDLNRDMFQPQPPPPSNWA
jgi:hypothetical protein